MGAEWQLANQVKMPHIAIKAQYKGAITEMDIYRNLHLRRMVLPVLKAAAFDMSIRNPHNTSVKVHLNTFKHKGYWYHGKNREHESMQRFSEIVLPGNTVIEVGGHIGYITQFFSRLVGVAGKVFVFEPGSNNLPYIRRNVASLQNTTLIEKGVGEKSEFATFYEDSLTGQNNSFLPSYEHLTENKNASFVESLVTPKTTEIVSLDMFLKKEKLPDFIKIDVEGFELNVLQGMPLTLARKPKLMIEITANHEQIARILADNGYRIFDDKMQPVTHISKSSIRNYFCT